MTTLRSRLPLVVSTSSLSPEIVVIEDYARRPPEGVSRPLRERISILTIITQPSQDHTGAACSLKCNSMLKQSNGGRCD